MMLELVVMTQERRETMGALVGMMLERPEMMEEWVETMQVEETMGVAGTMEVVEIRVEILEEIPAADYRDALPGLSRPISATCTHTPPNRTATERRRMLSPTPATRRTWTS
jgi:hypothetical protein